MKTLLIIKREYLTRVRKRSFLIMTLLVPVLFLGMGALIGYLSVSGSSRNTIAVWDQSGYFRDQLKNKNNIVYVFDRGTEAEVKKAVDQEMYDGCLLIPAFDKDKKVALELYSKQQLGIATEGQIQDQLNAVLVRDRMKAAGIKAEDLKRIEAGTLTLRSVNAEGREANALSSFAVGYGAGILLYFFMLFYGMSVMRSVMEEKTSRIAEIIVSSVKPYQLMLGKIIGVALVGLTQFLIWLSLITAISGITVGSFHLSGGSGAFGANMNGGNNAELAAGIQALMGGTDWLMIASWFLFYFLGGYFLYAALYAAVGSLVNEDPQESQQFTLVITIPIILGFVIMSSAIRDPNSGLALFGSLFPLTSPIVMMARIPFGVPAWQLATSAALLVLGFILATGLAAKIYRTGILMYGKKITFREVGKWLFR